MSFTEKLLGPTGIVEKMTSGPTSWSSKVRKTFLLTLPISLPLWALWCGVGMILLLIAFVVMAVITWCAGIWNGEDYFSP